MRAEPLALVDHRMAQVMCNLSEVEIFVGEDAFSTNRFRPKGLKEMRAKPLVLAKHRMAQPCDYL